MLAIGLAIHLATTIRFDSIRLDWMESVASLKCVSTLLFPLQPEGVAVVAVEKRKKSPAAAVGFRPTAKQFLQYIR